MRIIFMGTPQFAVPSLQQLAQKHEVCLVLTRPDAVRSRGKKLESSPVKRAAQNLGLPVLETKSLRGQVFEKIKALQPDCICVAAFGCLIPDEVLALPRYGCLNVHGSLLPRWRGAAPIQRAILAGDERIGISIMKITHELDAGDYCRQASVAGANKSLDELFSELSLAGAQELAGVLDKLAEGRSISWQPQDNSQVSYAKKLSKHELNLCMSDSAQLALRKVLASSDAASAKMSLAHKPVRICRARLAQSSDFPSQEPILPGAVLRTKKRLALGMDSIELLEILSLKPEAKKEMPAAAWLQGASQTELAWSELDL